MSEQPALLTKANYYQPMTTEQFRILYGYGLIRPLTRDDDQHYLHFMHSNTPRGPAFDAMMADTARWLEMIKTGELK
jgi:hypothetical protein